MAGINNNQTHPIQVNLTSYCNYKCGCNNATLKKAMQEKCLTTWNYNIYSCFNIINNFLIAEICYLVVGFFYLLCQFLFAISLLKTNIESIY